MPGEIITDNLLNKVGGLIANKFIYFLLLSSKLFFIYWLQEVT